ncbi:putative nucleotidyltransferase with HDIG domain [Paucibacter oligotrophus]|uniref:Putative nucleotidyltransferase with HDIG domain n=1 Tax=Roseateles oligotrophus TaxID=1769250 RepID=A0A840LFK4_9BURK|nr:HDOD domain-containing protein [Roseateles oligotrophus]MBB4844819.1 putative nucleotidyltransferase with HDIG domain [Roseateles oligotrophus]
MKVKEAAESLQRVRELPSLRGVVLDLLGSLNDPQADVESVSAKVALDQAITAKLLRLANSPFFGLSRQITSVNDAAAIVGLRSLRNIAVAAALVDAFDPQRCPAFALRPFWRHAIGVALAAEAMAPLCELEAATAFSAGLLHDIGRLALALALPETYSELLQWQQEQDLPLLEAEQSRLGLTHCEAGAQLAEQWLLPPQLIRCIALHHQTELREPDLLVDLIHLADNLCHALDLGGDPGDAVPVFSLAGWQRLGLSNAQLLAVCKQTETRHESLCQALAIC